jgi:Tol biopolymer transport system component
MLRRRPEGRRHEAHSGPSRSARAILVALAVAAAGCSSSVSPATESPAAQASTAAASGNWLVAPSKTVAHRSSWGIYGLRLDTQEVGLIYDTPDELSGLALSHDGRRLAFAEKVGGTADQNSEILVLDLDSGEWRQLTSNSILDTYPAWSPDDARIAFLSMRQTLDIYVMDASGGEPRLLYDSGGHDADISWQGDLIAFTRDSQIWTMRDDGSNARRLTDPPRAGQKSQANLPFGDYDPRISPDGSRIVFERLTGDSSANGNYDLFAIGTDGSDLTRLTQTDYAQGLASWSHSGSRLAFIVAAIEGRGVYDIYQMNADGSGLENATPSYFPPDFLCRSVVFSADDTMLYFVGEWWQA